MASLAPAATVCAPPTFTTPTIFGTSILSISANRILNYTSNPLFVIAQPLTPATNLSFCNVTVTYTHPNTNSIANVEIWLPPVEEWNGLLQTTGGAGFGAGRFELPYGFMGNSVTQGFVAVSGDAGLQYVRGPNDTPGSVSPEGWALVSEGNLDLEKMKNFGYQTLKDDAIIAKSIIKDYYGKEAEYSYFVGCSQGGRQGLSIAQHYPDLYDGILAGAPAINFDQFVASLYWPQMYMKTIGVFPPMCEMDAVTQAAIDACDELDGFKDRVIGDLEGCRGKFDVKLVEGKEVECKQSGGTKVKVSAEAVQIVNATWEGMFWNKTGERMWYGFDMGSDLTGQLNVTASPFTGPAMTSCIANDSQEAKCVGSPHPLGETYVRTFLAKDLNFDLEDMKLKEFEGLLRNAIAELGSYWGTNDADLSRFRDAGGKMITFHGLADNIIPSAGPREYYKAASSLLSSPAANPQSDIRDFYRFFDVPGLGHCTGGNFAQPQELVSQLRNWVEKGEAPESSPVEYVDKDGVLQKRVICPWPKVEKPDGTCAERQ